MSPLFGYQSCSGCKLLVLKTLPERFSFLKVESHFCDLILGSHSGVSICVAQSGLETCFLVPSWRNCCGSKQANSGYYYFI